MFAALLYAAFVPAAPPAAALSLFAEHVVEVQFSSPDGKPMADAEVHVFAPGNPPRMVGTGRTDKNGKYSFEADRDGLWSAEVHEGGQVARVTVRVGREGETGNDEVSPYLLIGGAVVLLILAVIFRILRARSRRPR